MPPTIIVPSHLEFKLSKKVFLVWSRYDSNDKTLSMNKVFLKYVALMYGKFIKLSKTVSTTDIQ